MRHLDDRTFSSPAGKLAVLAFLFVVTLLVTLAVIGLPPFPGGIY